LISSIKKVLLLYKFLCFTQSNYTMW
jgi:hypothetical protein